MIDINCCFYGTGVGAYWFVKISLYLFLLLIIFNFLWWDWVILMFWSYYDWIRGKFYHWGRHLRKLSSSFSYLYFFLLTCLLILHYSRIIFWNYIFWNRKTKIELSSRAPRLRSRPQRLGHTHSMAIVCVNLSNTSTRLRNIL